MLVSGRVPKFHVKILMGCGFGVGGLGLYGSQGYHPLDLLGGSNGMMRSFVSTKLPQQASRPKKLPVDFCNKIFYCGYDNEPTY